MSRAVLQMEHQPETGPMRVLLGPEPRWVRALRRVDSALGWVVDVTRFWSAGTDAAMRRYVRRVVQ